MDDLEQLKGAVEEAIKTALDNYHTRCPFYTSMGDEDLTPTRHAQHHSRFTNTLETLCKVRIALWVAVISLVTGGVGGLLWLGIKHQMGALK